VKCSCEREDCLWLDGEGENDHSCPVFVKSAIYAQMEDLDEKTRKKIIMEIVDYLGDNISPVGWWIKHMEVTA